MRPHVTAVDASTVSWRLTDPAGTFDRVQLWTDFDLGDVAFERVPGGWLLRRARSTLPAVDRLEYLFELESADEDPRSILDPGNPRRVGGAFGDHSWISLDYRPPAWLMVAPVRGQRHELVVDSPVGQIDVQLWSPAGSATSARLPLLLCHDGPEMDALGELTRFVGAMIAIGRLPPVRVGLLAPGRRDERYAANPAYAEALCGQVLPALAELAPTEVRPVLMGQSLGALAALHAEWTHPGTFAALLLESGSFFTPELDGHESAYGGWRPVTDFVRLVLTAEQAPSAPPITVCYGTAEENAANNRQLAAHLGRLGLDVRTGEVRDGHTFTCWRDLLDPHLVDLLALGQAQGR